MGVFLLALYGIERLESFVENSGLAIARLMAHEVIVLPVLLIAHCIAENLVNMLVVVDEEEQMRVEDVLVFLLDHQRFSHACNGLIQVVFDQLSQAFAERRLRQVVLVEVFEFVSSKWLVFQLRGVPQRNLRSLISMHSTY